MFLLSFCLVSKAQHSLRLNGKIVTEKKQALSFCNIIIKGQPTKGVVSDYDGNFSIDINLGDTLLVSYIGYETKYFVVKDSIFTTIALKQTTFNLSEFIVKPNKMLTAKKIIKKTLENWNQNHFVHEQDKTYRIGIIADFLVDKNQEKIYGYDGSITLVGYKDNRIYANLKDTSFRYQTDYILPRIYSLSGGSPYKLLIPQIFFQLFVNNKYSFEFGSIDYYSNQPVYHIKFTNKKGGGLCEGGGYYLISKNDFSLLYIETITKDCVGFTNEYENMVWKYAIVRTFFDKKIGDKRHVTKVESEIRYSYSLNNSIDEFFYKNKLVITEIIQKQDIIFDKQRLGYAEDVFYRAK